MQHEQADEAALRRAAAGDADAFGEIVERYQQVVFRAAYLVLRDAQLAEDVAQEAFVRAYGGLGRFRLGEPVRPWLLRIATNLALNEARARGRRAAVTERAGALVATAAPSPEGEAEAASVSDTVLAAMAELRQEDQVVLHLRYFLDLPEREIAVAIGKRPGTVKSRLHRASARLRDVIEQKYPGLAENVDG